MNFLLKMPNDSTVSGAGDCDFSGQRVRKSASPLPASRPPARLFTASCRYSTFLSKFSKFPELALILYLREHGCTKPFSFCGVPFNV